MNKQVNLLLKQGLPFGLMTYLISQLILNLFSGFSLLPLWGSFGLDILFILTCAVVYVLFSSSGKK